jgi:ribonucleoside-triphosphate reductase
MKTIKKILVPVECYTRVCGFFRPISHFNKGKKSEFKDRKTYDIKKIKLKIEKLTILRR